MPPATQAKRWETVMIRNPWYAPKRLAATALVWTLLAQMATPAWAVSPGYTGH